MVTWGAPRTTVAADFKFEYVNPSYWATTTQLLQLQQLDNEWIERHETP